MEDTLKRAGCCILESTLNTRELGGYEKREGGFTKYNSVIRSDAILHPTDSDMERLRKKHISTIIDMRVVRDGADVPSPFDGQPGFVYHNIPIEEGSQIPESTADVPYSYMRIAESRNMPDVFRCIAFANEGVLFHCSAGKDRTGVVSAILLMLAGVGRREIIENYMLTQECNRERFKRVKEKFPDIDIQIVIPHKKYMEKFMNMLCEKYSDVEGYLTAIGLNAKEISDLRLKL